MLKYAVIGCGNIGRVHCASIKADPQSSLLVVCDIDKSKARGLAHEFECKCSFNLDEVLNDSSVDVVNLCLPHYEHAWSFEKSLACGKHVICEKPLATTPEDVNRMVSLSEKSSLCSTVAFQHRHSPLIRLLKTYLCLGDFGEIVKAEINFRCERTMEYYKSGEWRGKWNTEGGGTLINQAIHTIDMANLFLGKPLAINGSVENREHPALEVEDFAQGEIFYENGQVLKLKAENSSLEQWMPLLKVEGTKGDFVLEGSDRLKSLNLESSELKDKLKATESEMQDFSSFKGKKDYGNMHSLVVSDFTEAILTHRKPLLSVRDASYANQVVLGFYHSESVGGLVDLPIGEYQQPILNNGK